MSIPTHPTHPSIPSIAGGGGSRYTVESLTFSGDLITDAVREAGVEGDGLTPPAGVGPWPVATNLVTQSVPGADATTGVTKAGDAGATLTLVTDATAPFQASQTEVWLLDNSAGATDATVDFAGNATAAAYTGSIWAKAISGSPTVSIEGGGTPTTITGTDSYARYSQSRTASAGDNLRITAPAGAVVRFTAAQLETGSIATPFVVTDGSTESRTAGRVSTDEIDIDSSQFAVAVRWNPGIANTALSTGTAVLFEKVVDSNNLIRGLYDWQNNRYELQRVESGTGSSHTKAHTFTAQSSQTVIFQGTPTGLTISVGGDFDAETANTAAPDVSSADLDYGSSAGSSSFLDGNARFIGTFTGELTNDDAAAIAALPSPPTWAQLVGALPSSAGVDTLWPCSTAQFFKAA